jgi:outer membrane protein TolC
MRPVLIGMALLLGLAWLTPVRAQEGTTLEQDIAAIEQMSGLGPDARELGLSSSVSQALRNNLGLQVRVRELEAATSRLKGSWSPWIPNLMAGWNYNPSRSEMFLDDYETWRRVNGDSANYYVGAGFNLFTGTSLSVTWAQGVAGSKVEYDPEVVFENPLDPDNPIELLANRDFKTRWSAMSLELNQSLLQGISPNYQLRMVEKARLAIDAAEVARDRDMTDVTAAVLKAYWDLVASRRLVEIQRIDRRLAQEQRSVTEARIAAGDLAPIELFRIDETVASSFAGLLEAERAADEAEQTLKLWLGVAPEDGLYLASLRPVDGITSMLPARDRESSLDAALSHNPDLVLARQMLASNRIDRRAAKHEMLPSLDLKASLSLNGSGFDADEAVAEVFSGALPNFQVGMAFTMPIPDMGAVHNLRATTLDLEAGELSLESVERQVQAGVETALRSIASYESQVEVAEVRVTLAARTAEASEATYQAGRNTLRDVLEAQTGLKEARQALVQAQVNELKARVDLEVLRGSLLETLGMEIQ